MMLDTMDAKNPTKLYTVYALKEMNMKTKNHHATLSERDRGMSQVSRVQRKGTLPLLGGNQERLPRGHETRAESRKMKDVGVAV